jgi:hypothetical protein
MINVIAQFETSLASGISKTSTTGVLLSNVTGDNDGATIPNGDYGVVIDERNSKREYAIITINGFNFTFVKRGLSMIDGDTVKVGNKFDHRKGSVIKIVTHPIVTLMVKAFNGEYPFGGVPTLPTTRTINNPRHIVDKEYADSLVTSSIPSLAVIDNGGITVNVNAGYFVLNGDLTYYPGASNQSLTNNATNYIQLKDGALSINTTGFEDDAMPLAKVITVSGDISLLQDSRAILSWIDIKSGYGLSRDATGIFIDLETSGGLIFNGGKLKVDDIYAKLLGDQTINGVKSFGSIPVLPASNPTTDNQAVRKKYVDDNFASNIQPYDLHLLTAATERNTTSTSYAKLKEIKINKYGVYKITFSMKCANGQTGYAKIYKNGSALGTERADATGNYQTFSESFIFDANDNIQIYAKTNNSSYPTLIKDVFIDAILVPANAGSITTD